LEKGKSRITPEIEAAFWHLAAAQDDVPAGLGGAVNVRVLAAPGSIPEGVFVPRTVKVETCARPGCSVQFIRTHSTQKYHDPECQAAWAKERRKIQES